MISNKKTARAVGALFLIVFITSLVGSGIVEDILYAPDYLSIAHPNKTQWVIGMLIHLISAVGTIGIVVLMFPLLKQQNINLAIAYLVFRSIEAIIFSITELNSLSILTLSQEFIKAGTTDTSYFQLLGTLLQEDRSWSYMIGVLFFCIGSLMFYYSMYKSQIIPRFLSVWGFMAIILALIMAILNLLDIDLSFGFVFYIPIALNEIVLSIWLIVKGFNSSQIELQTIK